MFRLDAYLRPGASQREFCQRVALVAAAFGCLALASGAAHAQSKPPASPAPVLTLEKALELAAQANRKIGNASLDVQKATSSLSATRTQQLPALALNATGSYNLQQQQFTVNPGQFGTYPGIGPIPSTTTALASQSGFTPVVSASISQPLLQLYRIGLEVDQSTIQQSMAQEQLRSSRQEVIKQVKQQYYEILKTQSSLQATEESIVFYRELSQLVATYVQQKVALEYQSLETQSRLARAEHKARTERNALQTQQELLNNLLGRDVGTAFTVTAAPAVTARPMDPANAEQTALAQRPDVQEAKLKLQHAQTGYKVTKTGYLPDLNLVMRYARLFNTEFIPPEMWTVGLELKWQVFDWGKTSDNLQKKTAEVLQAQNDILDVESQVRIEIDSRIRQVIEAGELIKVTEITQAASREKLRVLMNQFRQRSVLLKDVLQAASELADANSEHQQALLSLFTAQAQLDKALGKG